MNTGATSLSVKILTPSGAVFNDEASMVLFPAMTGEVGVLPGHAPTVFRLDPGVVKVFSGQKLIYEEFVFGGFANANYDQLNLLVDKVSKIEDLDSASAKLELEDLEKRLMQNTNTKLASLLEFKIRIARKILETANQKH